MAKKKESASRTERWIRIRPRESKRKEPEKQTEKEPSPPGIPRLAVVFIAVVLCWLFFDSRRATFAPPGIERRKADATGGGIASAVSGDAERGTARNIFSPFPDGKTDIATTPVPEELGIIRIASWNMSPLDFPKVGDTRRGLAIAELLNQFDVVAIQGIRARNRTVLDALVFLLGERGAHYAALTSSWTDRSPDGEGLAFLFNMDRIETDGETLGEIALSNVAATPPPLVASFRAVVDAPETAFTFCLVNVQLTPDDAQGRETLYDVYRAVRKRSGRNGVPEDDLILLGTFGAAAHDIGKLAEIPYLGAIHDDIATTFDGRPDDNIIFDMRATSEYVERFGIVDLRETFQLLPGEERAFGDHRPVWADFTIRETSLREYTTDTLLFRASSPVDFGNRGR